MKLITFSFMFQILKCMYKLKVGFCMCVSLDTTNTAMQKISKQVIRTYVMCIYGDKEVNYLRAVNFFALGDIFGFVFFFFS